LDRGSNMPYLPSIFNDPELLNKLIDVVQPSVKQAQATPPPVAPTVDPDMIKNVATKMADRLLRDLSISVDKVGSPLFMKHLQDPEELFDFLATSQVKYAGRPIVNLQYNQLTPEAQTQYIPYTWKEAYPAHVVATVGVYKDGLVAYLKSLQSQAGPDAQGKLLSATITRLVDEVNTDLKSDISHEEVKSTKEQPVQAWLPDDTHLDSVSDTLTVETPLVPGKAAGTIPVTPKDVKDKYGFDAFAKKVKVSKGGKLFDYEQNTSETFFCDILQVLHARAALYASRTGAYADKTYLQMVTELGGQYGCNFAGGTGAGRGQTGAGQAGRPTGLTPAILEELASLRPFNSQYISFPDITLFLDKYASYANSGEVNRVVDAIKTDMNNFKMFLMVPADTFQMYNLTTGQFKDLFRNPANAQLGANALYDIIRYAGSLYQQMLSNLQTAGREHLDAGSFRAMQQQVTPGGPQLTNLTSLNDLRSLLQQGTVGR